MITVLLTDGEFTGMIRALQKREDVRIVGFLCSENVAHRVMLDQWYIAPDWNDPKYIPFLYDVIEKEKVDFVFPIVTKSLELMASLKEEIYDRTKAVVVTSPYETIRIANNKAVLLQHLKMDPLTSEYITDFSVAETPAELKAQIRIPCAVKPVIGENKEGFLRVVSDEDWQRAFLQGEEGGLLCPSLLNLIDETSRFSEPRLVMEYLPGQEWDADLLVIDGKILSATIRKNMYMFGGLSACTETTHEPRILAACEKIVKTLGLEYLCCISFKEDEAGNIKLLEINPRAMGSIYVSAIAGNNLALRLLSVLLKEDEDRDFRLTCDGLRTSLYYDITPLPFEGENT